MLSARESPFTSFKTILAIVTTLSLVVGLMFVPAAELSSDFASDDDDRVGYGYGVDIDDDEDDDSGDEDDEDDDSGDDSDDDSS